MQEYGTFLASKALLAPSVGRSVLADDLPDSLFPFQRAATAWALRKGRAALFLDTGLGKSRCQLVWAERAAERALILAPLGVTRQTVHEGARIGIPVTYARSQAEAAPTGITITNYEMLHKFDPAQFGAVVLDESSILANFTGVTKRALIAAFRQTPMRLCCTATPMPNDTVELCNHADFLGIMGQQDMITTFFISKGDDQKDGKFRLKRHAVTDFYRWLASWALSARRPSDLGFRDDGYLLPPLDIDLLEVPSDYVPPGYLFPVKLKGVTDRAAVRRGTLGDRVQAALAQVAQEPDEQWLIWCGLNDEADAMAAGIPGAVNVAGSDSLEHKADTLQQFGDGRLRVLVTKPSIAGFGLNLQQCARMLFVGIGDSYQTYYQAIRRCWRFGQQRPVRVWIVLSDQEHAVYENVLRKEEQAQTLMTELIGHVRLFEQAELAQAVKTDDPLAPRQDGILVPWLRTLVQEATPCV